MSNDRSKFGDATGLLAVVEQRQHPDGTPYQYLATEDASHPAAQWRARVQIQKRYGDWSNEDILAGRAPAPFEVVDAVNNLLTTSGATNLWNGLVTAGLATPLNSTNTQLAVGDSSTAAVIGDTDLGAAAGTTITTSGISAATNATPIVLTNGSGSWTVTPTVGQVVVVLGVNGNTAANGTFEVSAATATTITLLNSVGNGAFSASAGATVKVVNKYRQLVSGAPTVTTNQVQWVSTFGTANANFTWNEWGVATGGAVTNKQAVPPPLLLNHAIPGGGLGTKTSAASWTLTVTLSLS